MKKLLLTSIALLMAASSFALEYEPTWRRADWRPVGNLMISSAAVDDYSELRKKTQNWPIPPEDLDRSVLTRNAFVEYMGESLKKKYPSYSVKQPYTLTNDIATTDSVKGIQYLYRSNIIFFAGHGFQQKLAFYNDTMSVNVKAFGGDIKWVFIDACEVLNVNKSGQLDKALTSSTKDVNKFNKLKDAFIGVHAILGYYSLGWQYPNNSKPNASHRSELKYKYFAKYFIEDGMTVWNAYKKAHQDYYKEVDDVYYKNNQEHIIGFKPAIAYMKGKDQYGRSHDASTETYAKTYEVALDPRKTDRSYTLNILYQEYGVPQY